MWGECFATPLIRSMSAPSCKNKSITNNIIVTNIGKPTKIAKNSEDDATDEETDVQEQEEGHDNKDANEMDQGQQTQRYNTESSKFYKEERRMVQALRRVKAKLHHETNDRNAEEKPLRPATEEPKKEAHEEWPKPYE